MHTANCPPPLTMENPLAANPLNTWPPACMQSPRYRPPPFVDRITHLWNYFLPQTSFADGKKLHMIKAHFLFESNDLSVMDFSYPILNVTPADFCPGWRFCSRGLRLVIVVAFYTLWCLSASITALQSKLRGPFCTTNSYAKECRSILRDEADTSHFH